MEYLADTVAIVRHFAKSGRIGSVARQILRDADAGKNTIYVSIISFVEIMYLAEIDRIPINLDDTKKQFNESDNYHIVDLNIDIIEVAKNIPGLELHDRLIAASSNYLGIPILTNDPDISDSGLIEVIW